MPKKAKTEVLTDQVTARLVANFLRQIAGCDWSKKELSELADAVEAGERKVFFDPDYHPEG